MPTRLEVLCSPAEYAALSKQDLSRTVCVVFDVLRATSTMITALANGAAQIIPVAEIGDALAIRRQRPEVLLGGEREGVRIRAVLAGGADFDLGNSPREHTADRVRGRTIVTTTTNGTRALRACASARLVVLGSFLNLRATAEYVRQLDPASVLLVGSGTRESVAYEDVLAAGALCDRLGSVFRDGDIGDSAELARQLYQRERHDLLTAMQRSSNARRLRAYPDLRDDVSFCLQQDIFEVIAILEKDGAVRRFA